MKNVIVYVVVILLVIGYWWFHSPVPAIVFQVPDRYFADAVMHPSQPQYWSCSTVSTTDSIPIMTYSSSTTGTRVTPWITK